MLAVRSKRLLKGVPGSSSLYVVVNPSGGSRDLIRVVPRSQEIELGSGSVASGNF